MIQRDAVLPDRDYRLPPPFFAFLPVFLGDDFLDPFFFAAISVLLKRYFGGFGAGLRFGPLVPPPVFPIYRAPPVGFVQHRSAGAVSSQMPCSDDRLRYIGTTQGDC